MRVIPSSKLGDYIHAGFGCWKCTSFWTALILSGNIYTAAITAEIYRQYTEWLTKKYPLVQAVEVLEKQQKIVSIFN